MGIGSDIKEVFIEEGVAISILRTPVNISESIVISLNESTDPFQKEFLVEASLPFDTVIVQGDILQIYNDFYLVTTKSAESFEGEIVEYQSNLLKCNVSGVLVLEPSQVQDPDTFKITAGWNIRQSDVHGLLYQYKRNAPLDAASAVGRDPIYELELFVPANLGIQKEDQIYLSASVYFRVLYVEKYKFTDVHVLNLVEDNREAYEP